MDLLDEKLVHDEEGHSQVQQPIIKREVDSLDDFEHLGHDSSPVKEQKKTEELLVDLLQSSSNTESPAGEVVGVINKEGEHTKAAIQLTGDDHDDDDDNFDRSNNKSVNQKMDTNLLEMGDTTTQQQQKENFDQFLSDISSNKNDVGAIAAPELVGDFKAATKNFVDMEREFIQPVVSSVEVLERYSDSESETEVTSPKKIDDDTIPITTINVTKSPNLSANTAKIESQPIKKMESPPPAPPKVSTTPIEKPSQKSDDVIAAEAMFCKMGLGK